MSRGRASSVNGSHACVVGGARSGSLECAPQRPLIWVTATHSLPPSVSPWPSAPPNPLPTRPSAKSHDCHSSRASAGQRRAHASSASALRAATASLRHAATAAARGRTAARRARRRQAPHATSALSAPLPGAPHPVIKLVPCVYVCAWPDRVVRAAKIAARGARPQSSAAHQLWMKRKPPRHAQGASSWPLKPSFASRQQAAHMARGRGWEQRPLCRLCVDLASQTRRLCKELPM